MYIKLGGLISFLHKGQFDLVFNQVSKHPEQNTFWHFGSRTGLFKRFNY